MKRREWIVLALLVAYLVIVTSYMVLVSFDVVTYWRVAP